MTTISEPEMPTIIAEQLEPPLLDRTTSRSRLAIAVGVGLTLFAVLNATAAVYLFRGISDLRVVEAQLEELGAFEQRISARLDTVNNGFQSRFEKLDRQLQGSFNEINSNVAQLALTRPIAGGEATPGAVEPPEMTTSTLAEAPEALEGESASDPGVIEAPRAPRKRAAPAAPPPPSSNYQRIQQADGKVTYRRIN